MTTLVALSARMFTFSAIFHYLLVIIFGGTRGHINKQQAIHVKNQNKVVLRGKKRHMKIFEDLWSLLEILVPIKFPPSFCTFQFSSHILVLSCCNVVCRSVWMYIVNIAYLFLSFPQCLLFRCWLCGEELLLSSMCDVRGPKKARQHRLKENKVFFLPLLFSLAYSEYDDYRIAPIAACSCKHLIYNIILVSVPPGLPS